jgi:uncharacterized protein
LLIESGHEVLPVNPHYDEIDGLKVYKNLSDISGRVDTLSVYIAPEKIGEFIEPIGNLKPGRVILNPGAESAELESALTKVGIPYLEACTLVLLRTKQF